MSLCPVCGRVASSRQLGKQVYQCKKCVQFVHLFCCESNIVSRRALEVADRLSVQGKLDEAVKGILITAISKSMVCHGCSEVEICG